MVYITDGKKSYAFYYYIEDGMNIITGSVFIGSLIDTSAIGLTNNEDNTYLQQADELQLFSGNILFTSCKFEPLSY